MVTPGAVHIMTTSWLSVQSPPSEYMVFVRNLLAGDYHRLGGSVIKDRKWHWSEPLTDQEAAHANIVLFQRKDALDAGGVRNK